jgi:type III restriction enzyme
VGSFCVNNRVSFAETTLPLSMTRSPWDWAISFKAGSVRHIYFVAETKGTMSSMKLREIEKTKIECARKFSDEISKRITADRVKYDVVTDYGKLMDLVGRAA